MGEQTPPIIQIKSTEQRATIAGILIDNGYTVRPIKIKVSAKGVAYGLEYFKESVERQALRGNDKD